MKTLLKKILLLFCAALFLPGMALAKDASWPDKLVLGLIPTESSDHITDRFGKLIEYLEKRLDMPIEVKNSTDYAGVITAMQFKHVDIAYFGPKSYCEAAARADGEAFALEVLEDGTQGYRGVIIVPKNSPAQKIEDLKGKTWAFNDPNSTSGYLVPMVHFMEDMKIEPKKYFSKVLFSGSHEASIMAVKAGKVDGASTNDLDLDRGDGKHWNQKEDFRRIWTSSLIPGSPMVYRKDLPASLKAAIKDAFLSYNDPEGLKMLKLKGYAAADDHTYDPIRKLIEAKKLLANN